MKFCSYFPYNAKLCFNGHEYLKRQLERKGIAYHTLLRMLARKDSVPSRRAFGASLLPSSVKASTICSWFFCRLSLIESRRLFAAPFRLGLRRSHDYYARC